MERSYAGHALERIVENASKMNDPIFLSNWQQNEASNS